MLRKFNITIDEKEYYVEMEELGTTPSASPVAAETPAPTATTSAPTAATSDAQLSPMPGKILDIKVAVGETVKENQVVLVLEAMKLENEIVAEKSGVISAIHTQAGATVNPGDALITIV